MTWLRPDGPILKHFALRCVLSKQELDGQGPAPVGPVGPVRREVWDDRRAKSPATTPSGLQGGTGRQRSHGRGAQENGGRIASGSRNGDGAIPGGF